jgi:hypothetical protein
MFVGLLSITTNIALNKFQKFISCRFNNDKKDDVRYHLDFPCVL